MENPWISFTEFHYFYTFTSRTVLLLSHTKSKEQLCGDSQAGTKPQAGSSSEIQGFGKTQ